jgi:hypothetical protein
MVQCMRSARGTRSVRASVLWGVWPATRAGVQRRAAWATLLLCALAAVPAAAQPRQSSVLVPIEHGGAIDWTRGLVTAVGAAPGDIRSPSPELARVGAERRARAQAHERLLAAARALRMEDRLVGAWADADAAVAERLAVAVARALDLTVDYGSDGSVVLTAGLPLEAVRLAVRGGAVEDIEDGALAARVRGPAARPTSLIIDARGVLDAPMLGVRVVAGAAAYAGPVVFHRQVGAAGADARRGARPVRGRARSAEGGRLSVELSPEVVTAANSARALVIVIIGKP